MPISAKPKTRRDNGGPRWRSGRGSSLANLRRPFDPEVVKQAERIVDGYQIVIRKEDGEYFGEGVELPGVAADGRTPQACVKAVREALVASVAHLIELGQTPPAPAGEARTEQVNLRLSPREKLRLESAAASKGFRGIADYVRASLLER